jgi:ribosomal protein S24E
MEYSSHQDPTPRERGIRKIALISIACVVLTLGVAVWLFAQNRTLQRKADSVKSSEKSSPTNDEIAKKVASVYDAPNEKPSVALVADKSKLPNEPFFQNAKQGDYVLIYPSAKIALIYRLPEKKVVNIGPIGTEASQ